MHGLKDLKEEKLSLNERAYRRINELIISLRLAPGSQVDERTLAERLGIGRTPIREALFRLAAEGLVETIPKRGFFIKAGHRGGHSGPLRGHDLSWRGT